MSKDEIDILDIDNKILQNFNNKKNNIDELKKRLETMIDSLELNNIRQGVKDTLNLNIIELKSYIKDIEENILYLYKIDITDKKYNFQVIDYKNICTLYNIKSLSINLILF